MPTVNKEVKETVTVSKEELTTICSESITEMFMYNPAAVLISDNLATVCAIVIKKLFEEEK